MLEILAKLKVMTSDFAEAQFAIEGYCPRIVFPDAEPNFIGLCLLRSREHFGHERVRGHDTIHLRASQSDNLWVNANTYLPVRERSPAVGEIDTDWLPRTAANLARFKLAVPAGFTHLVRQLPVSHR